MTVDVAGAAAGAGSGLQRDPRRAHRITSITLDNGTKIVENGALVPGTPNVDLATTNFTRATATATRSVT